MVDSYYTPSDLANKLVGYIDKDKVRVIADFCVGDGVLLRAAEKRWPDATCVATDISSSALSTVRKAHQDWTVGRCDLLNKKSRDRCRALNEANEQVDLVLLNPPFSCKGGTRKEVLLNGEVFQCSTALAFVVTALSYMSSSGCLYAILPRSVAHSERDARLWKALVSGYNLKVLTRSSQKYFVGCSPHIIIISLNVAEHTCISTGVLRLDAKERIVSIIRGNVPMNIAKKRCDGVDLLVHSTSLRMNNVSPARFLRKAGDLEVSGPAVLLPRVGTPRKDKICLLLKDESVVLSDCVIAIQTHSLAASKRLQRQILSNWTLVDELYQGTGARYVTLSRLKEFFSVPD